jgi:hypothetical protein
MIHALGYSQTAFDAADPGRLCRGRERWIEPFELDAPAPMTRIVLTSASFSDDSARDALRGLPFGVVPVPDIIAALFPRKHFLAFMEDGHPADLPPSAEAIEVYAGHRGGGQVEEPMVRWTRPLSGIAALREMIGDFAEGDPLRGLLVLDEEPVIDEDLMDRVFLMCGMSTVDSPPARYQPSALPDVLERARAVILFHRDKHGPALGIYQRDRVEGKGRAGLEERLRPLAERYGALLVHFDIPPMLARWDRALGELRQHWMATRDDEFPVPPASDGGWSGNRRRRGHPVHQAQGEE